METLSPLSQYKGAEGQSKKPNVAQKVFCVFRS